MYVAVYVTGCEEPGFLKHYSSKLVAIADFFKGNTYLVLAHGGKLLEGNFSIINFTIGFAF